MGDFFIGLKLVLEKLKDPWGLFCSLILWGTGNTKAIPSSKKDLGPSL